MKTGKNQTCHKNVIISQSILTKGKNVHLWAINFMFHNNQRTKTVKNHTLKFKEL